MNKYTFAVTLKNGDEVIKTFEALTLVLAQYQIKEYFKNNWLDFELLTAKKETGYVLFDKKEFSLIDLDFDSCFEKEQSAKDLLALYESFAFKISFLAIVLGAVGLGVVIGLGIGR